MTIETSVTLWVELPEGMSEDNALDYLNGSALTFSVAIKEDIQSGIVVEDAEFMQFNKV
jgi:hypothetical protein